MWRPFIEYIINYPYPLLVLSSLSLSLSDVMFVHLQAPGVRSVFIFTLKNEVDGLVEALKIFKVIQGFFLGFFFKSSLARWPTHGEFNTTRI